MGLRGLHVLTDRKTGKGVRRMTVQWGCVVKMSGVCSGAHPCLGRWGNDWTVNMPFELVELELARREVEETTCVSAVGKGTACSKTWQTPKAGAQSRCTPIE